MKKILGAVLGLSLTLAAQVSHAVEATWNYAVQVSATVQTSPPQIKLSWPQDTTTTPTSYTVFRKTKDATSWGTGIPLPGTATSYVDSNVTVGSAYEYQVQKATSGYPGYGYIFVGINAPLVENRGKVILLVDKTFSSSLTNEIARLQQDLVGDGWTVLRHDVARTDTVPNVKSIIKADYTADPANVRSVFILGYIPVPYSGNIVPDGHSPQHYGAWPADLYYGVMSGTWTDSTVNNTGATDPQNRNVPGDGKFDQSSPPAKVDLEVGRVDLASMPGKETWNGPATFKSELELMRQYLNKDHNFRHRMFNVPRRALVGDYFGIRNGEAFAASAWRNFAPFVGASNITNLPDKGTWIPNLSTNSYLWAYGCGAGSYTTIGGLGNNGQYFDGSTLDVVRTDSKAVFFMLFGSWLGDWDSEDNIMRAVLATSSYGLTCSWAGRPHWYYHHMGLGETIGYSARLTQNNGSGGLYRNQVNSSAGQIHVALMGDPTLRMHPVAPPSNLAGSVASNGSATLNWQASAETVVGYHVYRAANENGPFTRLTSSPISATTYTDPTISGSNTYMVRAVKLENTPSGTYFNPSQGVFLTLNGSSSSNQAPKVNAGSDQTITLPSSANLAGSVTDDGLPNPPASTTKTWSKVSGPGTVTFANASSASTTASFSAAGSYVLRLTANDGALAATDDVAITVNATAANQAPTVNAGADQTITLPSSANLAGSVTDDGLPNPPASTTKTWSKISGPGTVTFANASSASTTASFSAAGSYVLRLTANDGAITATDDVAITVNATATNQAPTVNAGADQTITLPSSANLAGSVTDDGLPNPPASTTKTWSKVSGPGTVTFANASSASTTASFSVAGSYVLRLTANDGAITATDDVAITVNSTTTTGSDEYQLDGNTTALYHFNGNFQDASSNAFHLTMAGNVQLISGNLGWMKTPSGQVARFTNIGDKLTASLPDSKILSGSTASPFTLEAWVYIRNYKAYAIGNFPIIELNQNWDASIGLVDGKWNSPAAPSISASSSKVLVSSSQWNAGVSKNAWHKLRITSDSSSMVQCFVDGKLLGSMTAPANCGRTTNWMLTLGNFDGDLDEVRLSNVVRTDTSSTPPPQPPPATSSDEYATDANTTALYHFNGNFQDASSNAFHLTMAGNVQLISGNLGWMKTPSGQVARFTNIGDKLTASLPDSKILPGSTASPFTLEAWVYVRNYKAYGIGNFPIIELNQNWDASIGLVDGKWNSPAAPSISASSSKVLVSSSQWNAGVSKNAWHKLRITSDSSSMVQCFVDGKLLGSVTAPANCGRTTNWMLTLGNFDGDLDEVRLSNVVRTDASTPPPSENQAPVVSAGSAQTITLPSSANLAGSVTDDGLPNPPASTTQSWSKVSGPGTVTFANASSATTTATFSTSGSYVLRLTANDGALSTSADVAITVNATAVNQAPVVNAGSAQTITLPSSANLAGSVTDDGLPNPPASTTKTWSKVSGPGTVTFANVSSATTTATFSTSGSYVLRLTANDGALSTSADVAITVNAALPPGPDPAPAPTPAPTGSVADDTQLILPKAGDHTLHILSPTLLELVWINTKAPDPARPANWDFVNSSFQLSAPSPSSFQVTANGQAITVQNVGFKRRALYAPLTVRDLRLDNRLYLQLANPIPDGQTVEVKNSSGTLWPSTTRFVEGFSPLRYSPAIHVNQEGYVPTFPKKAMVGYYLGSFGEMDISATSGFTLVDAQTQSVVYRGSLTARPDIGYTYTPTPYQKVLEADFSSFQTPGVYYLAVPGLGASLPFRIDAGIAMGFMRTYALGLYHQRCGTSNDLPFTRHTHGICHTAPAAIPTNDPAFNFTWTTIAQDSADYASNPRHTAPQLKSLDTCLYPFVRQGTIDVSAGHHDAGDYSKYTINSAALIHALMFTVDAIPGAADLDNLGLPESGDGISDLMQEAKQEADFLAKMQDSDGGFYFLVYPQNRKYENNVTPDHGDPQVVWPKTTAVTAAAVAALAQTGSSPRFKQYFPTEASQYRQKAKLGWDFLMRAIAKYGKDGSYQKITHYGDVFMHDDELAWAACEMFLATGDPTYQQQLMAWFDPADAGTRRWGWWRLWEAYGCATRDYAFAVRTGRLQASQMNATYLAKCEAEILAGAQDQVDRSQHNAYGTSFPDQTKRVKGAGWYFSTDQAFDIAVGSLLDPRPEFLKAILDNLNYEAGCNPVNMCYLTGLGQKRQREIVHQYAQNDRRILPPSGIPLGSVQSGFSYLDKYKGELGAMCFPSDGATTAPYPYYDRWGDSFNVSTEFIHVDQARSLGALALLVNQTTLKSQPWKSGTAQIVLSSTSVPLNTPVTATLQVPGMDLKNARIVWEARDQEPAYGPVYTIKPVNTGAQWVEVEIEWPDGRRIFATANFSVQL